MVHRGQGAYICGEETGLLDALEGKRGNPRLKPPFPANQGLYQGPTLINNVETLCNAPLIIEKGADWFKQFGDGKSTGTKIVSVSGNVQRPGNYEIELGIPGREIVYGLAGGPPEGREVKCWFPGGSSAPVLLEEHLDLPYDFEAMAEAGSMLGSGAIIVVDDSVPIVPLALRLAEFYRHESCGKCVALPRGHELDREDARAHRPSEGHADGPRDHGPGPGQHHRQLPVRARRLDGDAGRLDDRALPRRVRAAHGGGARARDAEPRSRRGASAVAAARREPRLGRCPPRAELDHLRDRRPRGARAEGAMLVDAAKHGDVEIPFFCYEPKLGQPVGACRMCLVEIEGIPKLQTSCSTPVRDGMVVNTTSDRVKHAQNAIVEFLLVNHPLDCPVCDKGGECPLQDISFGWGAGRSRFIEPKRHFKKPLELSPLVAIDRERCILCYRCVRFSQEVAEDYQLVFLERGDHTFVGTHDGRPYVAPFSGNIIELCPVGALTSTAYRFRARPVGHRGRGLGLHALPVPVQRRAHRPRRREGRARARARQRGGRRRLAVRQGPLRLPVVRAPERITAAAGARRRLPARGLVGARARRGGRRCERGRAHGRAGGRRGHQRGGLPAPAPDARGARLAARGLARGGAARRARRARSRGPTCRRGSPTSTTPARSSCSTPSSSTRRRSSTCACARRCAATARGWWSPRAARRRSTRTPRAAVRFAPGGGRGRARRAGRRALAPARAAATVDDLAAPRRARRPASARRLPRGDRSRAAGAGAVRADADVLRDAGDVVVIWGERARRASAAAGARPPRRCWPWPRRALGLGGQAESGLIEVPPRTNGRGLREVGCLPRLEPRASPTPPRLGRRRIASRARCCWSRPSSPPSSRARGPRGTSRGDRVRPLPHEALDEHADVVFPAEVYAEKEGTVTHPDGRLQRLRQAIGHPARCAPAGRCSPSLRALGAGRSSAASPPMVTAAVAEAVPFYAGLTLDEIGGAACAGRSARRRRRSSAAPSSDASRSPTRRRAGDGPARSGRAPRCGPGPRSSTRPRCASSPRRQRAELSVEDAERLGIGPATRSRSAGERRPRRAPPRRVRTGVPARQRLPRRRRRASRPDPGRGRRRRSRRAGGQARCRSRATLVLIVKSIVIFAVVLQIVPIILLGERKLLGRFQSRYGPNRVGPRGCSSRSPTS